MIDVHAHLHDPLYDNDRDQVIDHVFESGVERVITIGTSVEESQQAIELAHAHEKIFATAGLHPHVFNEIAEDDTALAQVMSMVGDIAQMAEDEKVLGIGEVGLDYHSHTDTDITPKQKLLQKTGFKEQIKVALHMRKALVVHCRDAYNDCYDVLERTKAFDGDLPIVFHCYGGDLLFTRKLMAHKNVYFSFTGNITYPVKKVVQTTKDDIRESVKIVPLERILSETDCPYLSPQKVRGTRNTPANVKYVVEEIAHIKDLNLENVIDQIRASSKKVFSEALM